MQEVVMSYSPGDWVALTRSVDGVPAGARGKVTSTGFFGGLDIELSTGARLVDVDAANVIKAAQPRSTGGDGCGLALVVAAGTASVVVAAARAWAGVRWGL
jgi:hypothetical protein